VTKRPNLWSISTFELEKTLFFRVQRKVSAPSRYASLDRHYTGSVTHHSESQASHRFSSASRQQSDEASQQVASRTHVSNGSSGVADDAVDANDANESVNSVNGLPCEFCSELQEAEALMRHQVTQHYIGTIGSQD
jgi:hypothetical protein